MRKSSLVLTTIVAVVALSITALGADTQSGTWKLNVAKSTYSPGPAPKSGTLKVESQADGVKVSLDGVQADGKPVRFQYSAKYDGKDHPVTGWDVVDSVVAKRIDDNTIETVMKKGGKVVMTNRSVVSKDGKTRTTTQKGTDAKGQVVNNTLVYEKQ